MKEQDTKKYLKQIFDLEVALYKHQQLLENYINYRNDHMPEQPVKILPDPPTEPQISTKYSKVNVESQLSTAKLMLIIGILGSCIPLVGFLSGNWYKIWYTLLLVMPFGVLMIILSVFSIKNALQTKDLKASEKAKNNMAEKQYKKDLQNYESIVSLVEENYLHEIQNFLNESEKFNQETSLQIEELNKVTDLLQTSLNNIYSKDIVCPKYRNLVDIARIYEYFESGRCTELEGANGAYNLYEEELRSNKAISSISQVIEDSENPQNGQYALCDQISQSTQAVEELLNQMNNTQALTDYCEYAEALAKSADVYFVGICE